MLDNHAFSLQIAQLTRTQNYSDNFTILIQYPQNAPDLMFLDQNTSADTDFSAPRTEYEDQDDDAKEEEK